MRYDPTALPAQRILVIAPHPDDESLGCGGLIASLAPMKRSFHTVFVTDGGASHLGSSDWPRARLAAQREREASDALEHLGVGQHPRTFLGLPDAGMPERGSPAERAALATLADIMETFRPDLALLPWRRDPHRDHRDSWRMAMSALAASGTGASVLEYAIWLEELGAPDDHPRTGEAERVVFDVSGVLAAKRAAIAAHLSQTTELISDDPDGFQLTSATIDRLAGDGEVYWRPVR